MISKRTFDSKSYDILYREVMERCLAIQDAIWKHDLLTINTSLEEWKELKNRFWNEYVYPKYEEVYFEMFLDRKRKKGLNHDDIQKAAIALMAWLKRDGFFHLFEGEIFFIDIDPSDLGLILVSGVPFKRYPPEFIGTLLERVAVDSANDRKKAKRLGEWVTGLAFLAGMLVWVLIEIIIQG